MQIVISIKKVRQLPSSKNSVQRVEFSFLFISIIHLFYLERMALSFMGEVSSLFHGKYVRMIYIKRDTFQVSMCSFATLQMSVLKYWNIYCLKLVWNSSSLRMGKEEKKWAQIYITSELCSLNW